MQYLSAMLRVAGSLKPAVWRDHGVLAGVARPTAAKPYVVATRRFHRHEKER